MDTDPEPERTGRMPVVRSDELAGLSGMLSSSSRTIIGQNGGPALCANLVLGEMSGRRFQFEHDSNLAILNSLIAMLHVGTSELLIRLATAPLAGSVLVGIIALCTLRWHRNETRRKALSEMLRSFVKAMQQLKRANDARLRCERIIHSFVPAEHTKIAEANLKQLQERYAHHLAEGGDAFISFEAEYAANRFRFGKITNIVISEAVKELSSLGEAVNNGNFGAAESILGLLSETYANLVETARRIGGRPWLKLFPILLMARFQRPKDLALITKEQMDQICALVHKRITTQAQATFQVFPPQCALEHPEWIYARELSPQLVAGKFCLLFQDGATHLLSLPELVVFTHQLLFLAHEQKTLEDVEKAKLGNVDVKLEGSFSPEDLMKPDTRRQILGTIAFASESSESVVPDRSQFCRSIFEDCLQHAKRVLAASPKHSVFHRKLEFGRWLLHIVAVEDRERKYSSSLRTRSLVKEYMRRHRTKTKTQKGD